MRTMDVILISVCVTAISHGFISVMYRLIIKARMARLETKKEIKYDVGVRVLLSSGILGTVSECTEYGYRVGIDENVTVEVLKEAIVSKLER